jgi:hypothetical protein
MAGQGKGQRQEALYDKYRPYLKCQARLRKYRPASVGRGRTAVCVVGQARTLVTGTGSNTVRETFMHHLLLPLAANGTVDVFVRIKAPPAPGPAATARALRDFFGEHPSEHLRLASLVVEADPPVQVPSRPSCNGSTSSLHAHWSAPRIMASCYAQIRGAHDCLQDVRRAERSSNVTYGVCSTVETTIDTPQIHANRRSSRHPAATALSRVDARVAWLLVLTLSARYASLAFACPRRSRRPFTRRPGVLRPIPASGQLPSGRYHNSRWPIRYHNGRAEGASQHAVGRAR